MVRGGGRTGGGYDTVCYVEQRRGTDGRAEDRAWGEGRSEERGERPGKKRLEMHRVRRVPSNRCRLVRGRGGRNGEGRRGRREGSMR